MRREPRHTCRHPALSTVAHVLERIRHEGVALCVKNGTSQAAFTPRAGHDAQRPKRTQEKGERTCPNKTPP